MTIYIYLFTYVVVVYDVMLDGLGSSDLWVDDACTLWGHISHQSVHTVSPPDRNLVVQRLHHRTHHVLNTLNNWMHRLNYPRVKAFGCAY